MLIKGSAHEYPVVEVASLREALERLPDLTKVYALADAALFELPFKDDLALLDPARVLKIEATEEQKSFERLTPLFTWLLENRFRRDSQLLVIGGGVLQDIGCFLASVLFRGVPWLLIPTTLLAQCDSCIGSKSSINVARFKNQIGTFHPPHGVWLSFAFLETLPRDEIRSGMGEVIKLHLLSGQPAYQRLQTVLQTFQPTPHILAPMIRDSLAIKKEYIELDEFDRGPRNLLNYGHTFGHAYESATHYGIPHGIAVSLGMATATYLSERLGLAPAGHFQEIDALLAPFYEPYGQMLAGLHIDSILAAIKLDKKNTQNAVNCILTRGPGRMEKRSLDLDAELRPLLAEFLTRHHS